MGTYFDPFGYEHPIPQTMAEVDIELESGKFQAWYQSFVSDF
jgi:hypothetical protein